MKKLIVILAVVLTFGAVASAQSRALGIRMGEISYQHELGSPTFVEIDLGYAGFTKGIGAAATCNFILASPAWTDEGEWNVYAGIGAALGGHAKSDNSNSSFYIGALAQVGLEYTFTFPLQLSLDLRPAFGFAKGGFWNDGLTNGLIPSLGIRYRF